MAAFGGGGRGRGWDKLNARDMKFLKEKFVGYAPRFGSTGYTTEDKWLHKVFAKYAANECQVRGTLWAIITASGARVKGNHQDLQAARAAFDKLPEAERKPAVEARGTHNPKLFFADVAPPAGALFVNVYCRPLERDARGAFHHARKVDLTEFGGRARGNGLQGDFGEPQRECLWLTEAEWKALAPAKPRQGDKIAIPAAVRQRIFLFYVFNWFANSGGGHWAPQHLRDGALTLTVTEVKAKAVRLRLHGHAAFKGEAPVGKSLGGHIFRIDPGESGQKNLPAKYRIDYDVRVEGVVEYDPVGKKFTRFDAVALGDYQGPWGLAYKEKPVPVGIAFQLDRRKLGPEHRHAPFTLSALREHYWAPDRWRPRQ
jgi:hypothetical protein